MKKLFFSLLFLFILSACSQGENIDTIEDQEENEVFSIQDVKIPDVIFISEKRNSIIDEEEIKLSIKTYLDSSEELFNAREPFQDYIDEEEEFTTEELEKLDKISKLTKENDENFSNYILNNTLPEGYEEESKRISGYITAVNEMLHEINVMFDDVMSDANEGVIPKVNLKSLISNVGAATGKEQKKIEEFLDKKSIKTKAFGRDD
ncbi:NDxxF motif lipoprotein [Solibacillus cecembensis]|uniref:NDxxF motif lipoprotein n=1 Tax=Solibacillus cecembensis TaxID=459347 RepID=UPI003D01704D